MERMFRTAADRQKNSPFKNEAFAKFGSSASRAILNSRMAPTRRVRVPLISPEMFKAKLDKSSFEQDDEDNEKKDMKDAKEIPTPVAKGYVPVCVSEPDEDDEDSETSTSSGSDTTSSSSSSEDEESAEEEEYSPSSSDERDEVLISQSSSYALKQIKDNIVKSKQIKKLEVKNEPLFTKPLELCEASMQYLDKKCSLKPGERESTTIIKQSQEEYQRNRAAFREIRRKDWEKRHQRREQKRQTFKKERELEAKEEIQSSGSDEDEQFGDGDEEKPILVRCTPLE